MRLHPLCIAFACHQKTTREVGAHHGVPATCFDVHQGRRELAACVVDQTVDASVGLQYRGNGGCHLVFFADVAHMKGGRTASLGDFLDHLFKFVRVSANQCDARAQGR